MRGADVEEAKVSAWIQTYTGTKFHLLDPRPEEVHIFDIAHALSNQCRFTGHTRLYYSVAEHSMGVSNLVPPALALAALLHDASEAYLSDLNRPAKKLTPIAAPYAEIEEKIMTAIFAAFRLPPDGWHAPEIKKADDVMLFTEKAQLMAGMSWADDQASNGNVAQPLLEQLACWLPWRAEENFLARYNELAMVRKCPRCGVEWEKEKDSFAYNLLQKCLKCGHIL